MIHAERCERSNFMQKTPGDSPEERAEYWTGVIEDARKYRAGVSAYLRDKGLQKNNYYQWYKKLRKQHPEWNDLEGPKTRELKSRKRPEIEVPENPKRRRFTADYKTRILRETDAAKDRSAVAAILRREGLHTQHLTTWRTEREQRQLEPVQRGPKPNPEAAELKKLKVENERLKKRLYQADKIIEFQKKIAELFGETLPNYVEEDLD